MLDPLCVATIFTCRSTPSRRDVLFPPLLEVSPSVLPFHRLRTVTNRTGVSCISKLVMRSEKQRRIELYRRSGCACTPTYSSTGVFRARIEAGMSSRGVHARRNPVAMAVLRGFLRVFLLLRQRNRPSGIFELLSTIIRRLVFLRSVEKSGMFVASRGCCSGDKAYGFFEFSGNFEGLEWGRF